MALSREVVNFIGTNVHHYLEQAHRVGHVCEMEMEMRMSFEMGDAFAEVG